MRSAPGIVPLLSYCKLWVCMFRARLTLQSRQGCAQRSHVHGHAHAGVCLAGRLECGEHRSAAATLRPTHCTTSPCPVCEQGFSWRSKTSETPEQLDFSDKMAASAVASAATVDYATGGWLRTQGGRAARGCHQPWSAIAAAMLSCGTWC